MEIGARIRSVRETMGFSQGDLERATGLLRSYISRIEHGHTMPSVANLERIATAFGMQLHDMLNEGVTVAASPPARKTADPVENAESRFLAQVRGLIGRISQPDRKLLLDFARMLARQGQTSTTEGRRRGRPRKHPLPVNADSLNVPELAAQPLSLSEGRAD